MIRKIIQIDSEKCTGCGLCASACQEEAIAIVEGKATLIRDDYCDGLGNCLPACPTGAITFIEREAAAYDEEAVERNKRARQEERAAQPPVFACPGSRMRQFNTAQEAECSEAPTMQAVNRLAQWPVQIQLVPPRAPYFNNADLLIAADCTAFAYAAFHERFMKGRITLVGCPKLDPVDYSEKLTRIFRLNTIRSITVARMEVPCCGGLERAVRQAILNSGKIIPYQVSIISTDGRILS